MAASTTQRTQFITDVRRAVTAFYEASSQCRHLVEKGGDMLLLSGAGALVDADFINENSGVTLVDFLAAGTVANAALSTADRVKLSKIVL